MALVRDDCEPSIRAVSGSEFSGQNGSYGKAAAVLTSANELQQYEQKLSLN